MPQSARSRTRNNYNSIDKFRKPVLKTRRDSKPKPMPSPRTYERGNFLKPTVSSKAKRSISRSPPREESNQFYQTTKVSSPNKMMIESKLDIDTESFDSPCNGQSLTSKFSTINKDEDSQEASRDKNEEALMTMGSELREIEDIVGRIDPPEKVSEGHIQIIDGSHGSPESLDEIEAQEERIMKPP
jgi:hypothetical protein